MDTKDVRKESVDKPYMEETDIEEMIGCLIDAVEDWLAEKDVEIDNPKKESDEEDIKVIGSDYDRLASAFRATLSSAGLIPAEGSASK